MKFIETKIGNKGLELILLPLGKEEIEESLENNVNIDSDSFFFNMLEWNLGNGMDYVDKEEIGALTDSHIIKLNEKIFWFPNYQIESPMRTLYDNGSVIFSQAE